MKKTSTTVVFFGSGPVAAESLRLLVQDFEVEAVVTKPRPEHHKGEVPVLELAEKLGLNVSTVANRRELDALVAAKPFKSPLGILIDFGIIVSQDVIDYFPLGIINSHFSLLPEWRGADPITFSILSGQKRTGVSLMLLVAAMDEGPLLGYGEYDLPAKITTPRLTNDLISLSHALLQAIIPAYVTGEAIARPQDSTIEPTYSRKLTKEDGILDWYKPAAQLEREVRAFLAWPKSRAIIGKIEAIITGAHVAEATGDPGEIKIQGKELLICCGEQALAIDRLKPAGKQEMTGEAFLAGYKKQLRWAPTPRKA